MRDSSYKQLTVSRGFKYNYYLSEPPQGSPVLVFLHGFGMGSKDWRHQVVFFKARGYGILAPDLLGYAGTSMPSTPHDLKHSLMSQDILEILDAENIRRAIFIAQGSGSALLSRIALLHPRRVMGCAFISIPFNPPNPDFDYQRSLKLQEAQFGRVLSGWWEFVAEGTPAVELVRENFDVFFNIMYPENYEIWKKWFGPVDGLRTGLKLKKQFPHTTWLTPEDRQYQYDGMRSLDMHGPFMYYQAYLKGIQAEDDRYSSASDYLNVPSYFAGGKEDPVCLSELGGALTQAFCIHDNTMIHEFEGGQWLHLDIPEQLNKTMLDWMRAL